MDAPNGMVFYCPIRYKSKIWRTTKLVAGKNGRFMQRHDGSWMRIISGDAFLTKDESDRACLLHNEYELQKAEDRFKLEQKTVYNLSKVVFYSQQKLVIGDEDE